MKFLKFLRIGIALFTMSVIFSLSISAAPLLAIPMEVEQPDGTTLAAFASGDISFNYVHDSEGRIIKQHPQTGFWVYATLDESGMLIASNRVALEDGYYYLAHRQTRGAFPISAHEITTSDIDFSLNAHLIREREVVANDLEGFSSTVESTVGVVRAGGPIEGHIENIIIMIAFADQDPTISQELQNRIDDYFNTSERSLSRYIEAVSGGLVTINSTLVGMNNETVLMYQHPYPRYRYVPYHPITNPRGYQPEEAVSKRAELLARAVSAVDGSALLEGKILDALNPGTVDTVTFIVSGQSTAWGNLLWPHSVSLRGVNGGTGAFLNGVRVDRASFLTYGHLRVTTIIHEQLHNFSFPDLYRYSNIAGENPVGRWDIMALPDSTILQFPNTHTKQRYAGWGNPIVEITERGTFTLSSLGTSDALYPTAYAIPIDNSTGEFILIEYRSPLNGTGFDNFTGNGGYSPGLIISRINPKFSGNGGSRQPDFHDEVYIFRPNTTVRNIATAGIHIASLAANHGRTSFGSESGTGYRNTIYTHAGINSGIVIYNVSEAGETITFNVAVNQHPITFELNGGSVNGSTTDVVRMVNQGVNQESIIGVARVPRVVHPDAGHTLLGWQENGTGPILTTEQVGEMIVTGPRTFRALWAEITEWEQLRTHITRLPAGSHTVQILRDIEASIDGVIGTAIEIPPGVDVTLKGHDNYIRTLTQNSGGGHRHFIVNNHASLILGENITLSGGSSNPINPSNSGGVQVGAGGTLIMQDNSVIEDCRRGGTGGAVHLFSNSNARATFIMNGGIIRNNQALQGGGVDIQRNGYMIMTAGTIEGNRATHQAINQGGGGVSVRDATAVLTMSGGIIRANETLHGSGGGVLLTSNSTFMMSGEALITDNITRANWISHGGGGVMVDNATFNMSGGTISYNQSPIGFGAGAGVFIGGSESSMTMTGGIIDGNETSNLGGGIFQNDGTVMIEAGYIINNVARNNGGGVYVNALAANSFIMTGGMISNNVATNGDGGGLFTTQHTYESPLPAGMHYPNIKIGANANFIGNSAGGGGFMPPENAATATNIATTATSSGGFAHVLNNLDINFRGGTGAARMHLVRFLDGNSENYTLLDSFKMHEGSIFAEANIPADPIREGYAFIGWAQTPDGEVEPLVGKTITTALNFYAVWQQQLSFTITFDANGGINAPNTQTKTSGVDLLLTLAEPTRTGYTFLGWATTANATEAEYQPGGVFTRNATTTLFAVWQQRTFAITFNANGGINAPNPQAKMYGVDLILASNEPTRTGYRFIGWARTANATEAEYQPGGLFRRNVTTTLFALWQPIETGSCNVIAEGRFPNQVGTDGLLGAPWLLCDDGVLEVGGGFINWTGIFSPWQNYNADISKIVFIEPIMAGSSLRSLFNRLSFVTVIEGLEYFDTRNVTNMSHMFEQLANVTDLALSSWDTSSVTNMSSMFSDTRALTTIDVSNWNTSNVTSMNNMFSGVSSLSSLNVSNWDTSNVTNMSYMFAVTSSLSYLDVSNWDTSNVTNMSAMFRSAVELASLDVSNWNTGRVTNMSEMFAGTRNLVSLNVSSWDTSSVVNMSRMFGRVSAVVNAATSGITSLDVSNWDTSNVTNMSNMFWGASQLMSLDLSNWNTDNVTNMSHMFADTNQLMSLDVSNWNTSRVTTMNMMFTGATALNSLTLGENFEFRGSAQLPQIVRNAEFTGYWQNIGNGTIRRPRGNHILTSAQLMAEFNGSTMADTWVWQPVGATSCYVIAEGRFANQVGADGLRGAPWMLCDDGVLEVGGGFINWTATTSPWNNYRIDINKIIFNRPVTAGASLTNLFRNLSYVTTIEGAENINTSNVTSMYSMFRDAHSLTGVDVSSWDTSQVTTMQHMFREARSLIQLDVSGWDTAQVTSMGWSFAGTRSLNSLDVSNFDTSSVISMVQTFAGASSLTSLDVSNWDVSSVRGIGSMFADASQLSYLDVSNWDTANIANMSYVFRNASQLSALDVSNWDTRAAVSMPGMFEGASSLINLDLSNWDTDRVTNMSNMFKGTSSLRILALGEDFEFKFRAPNPAPGLPSVSQTDEFTGYWQNVGDGTTELPKGQHVLTSEQLMVQYDGSTMADTWVWQPIGATSCNVLVEGRLPNQTGADGLLGTPWVLCDDGVLQVGAGFINWTATTSPWSNYRTSINEIVFTGPITAGASLTNLFRNMPSLTVIEGLENFDTSNVTNMSQMFFNASQLTDLDLSSWDTSHVIWMNGMFSHARQLTNLDVSTWDTSRVTSMASMFMEANQLTSMEVTNWDTSNVTCMQEMFRNAHLLTSLNASNWDTSSVGNMNLMFSGAGSLQILNALNWDTSQVTNMGFMFNGARNLRALTIGENFEFRGSASLPEAPQGNGFTGFWQNIGTGTIENPTGDLVLTSAQLMAEYNGATIADTWVWQPVR